MPQLTLPTTLGAARQAMNANGLVKNNFAATSAPTSADNSGAGYEIGSRWVNTATGQKWTLTGITGAVATWTLDASSTTGGESYDDTEVRGLIAGNAAATNALTGRVTAAEASISGLSTTSGQHTGQIGGLTTRVTALEAGGGSGGLTSVAHDTSLTGTGTSGSPLAVARPVPEGTSGQVVGYGSDGALTPVTLSGGGPLPSNVPTLSNLPGASIITPFKVPATMTAGSQGYNVQLGFGIGYAVQDFGAVMSTHTEAEPSQAVMQANLVALQAAIDKASELGFTVFIPSGKLYIWGTAYLKVGVSIRGEGKFTSRIVQRQLPTSMAENWIPTFAEPAVTGNNQGGNGLNFISDLGVDCGWNMRDFIGATGPTNANWMFEPDRMVGHAIVFATSSNGPQTSTVRPTTSGTDPHCRIQNVYLANVPGAGVHMSGRGENFIIGLETSRCATHSIYDNAADCWILDSTGYLNGDCGLYIDGGGGNLRLGNDKFWFCGMSKRVQPIGACYYSSSAGTKNIIGAGVSGQDSWDAIFDFNHNGSVLIWGQADEAGGGRVEAENTGGYEGARSRNRCFIRLRTARKSEMHVTISGGDRNGEANRPFLCDFMDGGVIYQGNNPANPIDRNAGIRHNDIYLSGSLDGINMTTGANPLLQRNGVVCTQGYVNAGRINHVYFGKRLLHGHMTAANLNDPNHAVNDPLYGPSEVIMDTGVPAYRKSSDLGGGWEMTAIDVTETQWSAMTTAQRASGKFRVFAADGTLLQPRAYGGFYRQTIVRYVTQAQYDDPAQVSAAEKADPVYIFQIIAAA